MTTQILFIIIEGILLFFLFGIKIIRPTHRGLIERLGKYYRFARPGFHWIIPFIDKMYVVNTTEQTVDAQP
jgi:regulator of protease activity HflC (stomatin/prohibitin superfamily)